MFSKTLPHIQKIRKCFHTPHNFEIARQCCGGTYTLLATIAFAKTYINMFEKNNNKNKKKTTKTKTSNG